MTPVDFRNETWDSLQSRLTALRLAVWQAWEKHGPGTTQEVAERAGISILTFRPRSTELYQLGFLALVSSPSVERAPSRGASGIYRARTLEEARHHFECARGAARSSQMELALASALSAPPRDPPLPAPCNP